MGGLGEFGVVVLGGVPSLSWCLGYTVQCVVPLAGCRIYTLYTWGGQWVVGEWVVCCCRRVVRGVGLGIYFVPMMYTSMLYFVR